MSLPSVNQTTQAVKRSGYEKACGFVQLACQLGHIGKTAGRIDRVFGVLSDIELRFIKTLAAHLIDEFDEQFVLCQGT